MPKGKLILVAIAVFAVVGGVFASKARLGDVVFTKNPTNTAICDQPFPFYTTTNRGLGIYSTSTTFTTIQGTPCTTSTLYIGL